MDVIRHAGCFLLPHQATAPLRDKQTLHMLLTHPDCEQNGLHIISMALCTVSVHKLSSTPLNLSFITNISLAVHCYGKQNMSPAQINAP